ncbi:MAG: ATP-binding protein [Gemmatimonadota bacterium]
MRFIQRQPRDDHRRALHEFGRSLALIVDEEELRQTVTAQLRSVLGLERVLLFLRDDDDGPYRLIAARGVEAGPLSRTAFPPDGRLVRWLRVNEEPLLLGRNAGVAEFLEAAERDVLSGLGVTACVPLVAMNRLTGFLLVRPDDPGWPSPGQHDLLLALAGQAALACENAALLSQQKARLRRMYRAERLATAGELAAGAAHEIRNPLTGIRSAIQLIRGDYPEGSRRHELVGDLLEEVDRIDEIVAGLLSFARPEDPSLEPVDLREILDHSLTLVRVRARTQGVEVTIDGPGSLPLHADPALLRQVILNVVLNALQAMPEGGRLHIAATRLGRRVELRVVDTGGGIPPEHVERVFDPFFTTKTTGTGLGLSICYGIIQRHGGQMEIDSQVGAGTSVIIRLPERARS